MKPESHLPTRISSSVARETRPMSPDSPMDNRHVPLSVNESESGVEASMSSMCDEDDDDDVENRAMTDQDPPLLQRAVRSAKRSAAQAHHKPLQGDFARRASSYHPQPSSDLESLPKEEQDMAMAGVANATMSVDPVVAMSTSSSSSIGEEQQHDDAMHRQQQSMQQPRNIPTPSSGYDGDSEGTAADTTRPPPSARAMEHYHRHRHHHHHRHPATHHSSSEQYQMAE